MNVQSQMTLTRCKALDGVLLDTVKKFVARVLPRCPGAAQTCLAFIPRQLIMSAFQGSMSLPSTLFAWKRRPEYLR